MFLETEFWTSLALLSVLGLGLWKGLSPMLAVLDARCEAIRSELAEAQNLKEEALAQLAKHRQRKNAMQEEVDATLSAAMSEVDRLRKTIENAFNERVQRRTLSIKDRVSAEERTVVLELRNRAVDLAISAVKRLALAQHEQDLAILEASLTNAREIFAASSYQKG